VKINVRVSVGVRVRDRVRVAYGLLTVGFVGKYARTTYQKSDVQLAYFTIHASQM
jgi:hypothetical protein